MATTSKRTAKKTKAKRRQSAKKSQPKQTHLVQTLRRELAEALEQQAAASEILRVISSSPTDLQPVFQTISTEIATTMRFEHRASRSLRWRVSDAARASWTTPEFAEFLKGGRRPSRETPTRLAGLDRRTFT